MVTHCSCCPDSLGPPPLHRRSSSQLHVTVLFLLLLFLPGARSGFDKVCTFGADQSAHMCGTALADMMYFVCSGLGGFSPPDTYFVKRSAHKTPDIRAEMEELKNDRLFLDKRSALSFLGTHEEHRHGPLHKRRIVNNGRLYMGIVCECCSNQCSMAEMRQYCASPSGKTKRHARRANKRASKMADSRGKRFTRMFQNKLMHNMVEAHNQSTMTSSHEQGVVVPRGDREKKDVWGWLLPKTEKERLPLRNPLPRSNY